MSTISVHDVQGFSTYNNTVRIPNGHKLDIAGDLVLPVHTTSTRPSGELGAIGFNSQTGELEVYVEINGTNNMELLSQGESLNNIENFIYGPLRVLPDT